MACGTPMENWFDDMPGGKAEIFGYLYSEQRKTTRALSLRTLPNAITPPPTPHAISSHPFISLL